MYPFIPINTTWANVYRCIQLCDNIFAVAETQIDDIIYCIEHKDVNDSV